MHELIENFANPEVLRESWPYLLQGFRMTVELCLLVVPLGLCGGLAVALLGKLGLRWLNFLLAIYIDFFRAFPPLVLLIFVYYALPMLGVNIPGVAAVALAFLLNTSAYYGEIFRAGIESIGRGQTEAARSTGLTRLQALVHVVIPQALRNVLPDLVSNTLEVMKMTALASVVALPDLLRMARLAQGSTYNPTPLFAAAVIYFLLMWPLVRLLSRFESRILVSRA